MARYEMEGGTVVDTEKATHCYKGESRRGGYGHISRRLYRSRKGRWYVETWHSWSVDGQTIDSAEWVSPREAVRFLVSEGLLAEDQIGATHPELAEHVEAVVE